MTKTSPNRRTFLAWGLSFTAGITVAGHALAKTISRFSLSKQGFALKGYDATAYFETNSPANGSDASTVQWQGAQWRFLTEQDAALFRANPEAYAPQFGGYCTRAMSLGKEVPGDPEVWRIYKNRLYVFFAPKGGTFFDKGKADMIARAQKHWDTLTFRE